MPDILLLIKFESVRNHKDYKALKLPELIDVFLKSGYLDEDADLCDASFCIIDFNCIHRCLTFF